MRVISSAENGCLALLTYTVSINCVKPGTSVFVSTYHATPNHVRDIEKSFLHGFELTYATCLVLHTSLCYSLFLYNGYRVSLAGIKRPGRGPNQTPPARSGV